MADYYDEDGGQDYDEDSQFNILKAICLAVGAILSFYYQAVVTEERFVPALNVIAKRLELSNDVAGATIMAAGASAPELFAALVSTFITRSSLGMGTVVGSLIFNQLAISAGAIHASKNKVLILDPLVFIRDVTFYAISLVCLFYALRHRGEVEYDDSNHLFITKRDSWIFLLWYFFYVALCANYDWILGFFHIKPGIDDDDKNHQCNYEAFKEDIRKEVSLTKVSSRIPFVRSCGGQEPARNFHSELSPEQNEIKSASSTVTELYVAESSSQDQCFTCTSGIRKKYLVSDERLTTDMHGIEDIEKQEDGSVCLHLWQRSTFYDMAKIDMNAWQLRWFTFSSDGISSLLDRPDYTMTASGTSYLPHYQRFEVDERRMLIKVKTRLRDYIFLAPSEELFLVAVAQFEKALDVHPKRSDEKCDMETHSSLIDLATGSSPSEILMYIITFPPKALIQFTIPDVRNGSIYPLTMACVATFASILSLIAGSFLMVETLDGLAHIFQIPEAVVGATISAAGSSIPPYISSCLAASLGLGNMAISNVFGSNTFNVLIGLGVPWALYTTLYEEDYTDLSEEGIDESIIMLAVSLLIFIGLVLLSGFKLLLWHARLFNAMYIAFVIYSMLQCFVL